MIDLHTHTLFSDGELLPSELVRRAIVAGYKILAITDHVDMSNADFVVPRIVKACRIMNKHWNIQVLPGAEITHPPLEEIPALVRLVRAKGAKIVVGHGETVAEPVIEGTNKAFIKAGVDILAHPGLIKEEDVQMAVRNKVALEITTRKGHGTTNKNVLALARKFKAMLVINNDAHSPGDILDDKKRRDALYQIGLTDADIDSIYASTVKTLKSQKKIS